MIRAVAFVFVLHLTGSIMCEHTTNYVTRFYEPSTLSDLDLYWIPTLTLKIDVIFSLSSNTIGQAYESRKLLIIHEIHESNLVSRQV